MNVCSKERVFHRRSNQMVTVHPISVPQCTSGSVYSAGRAVPPPAPWGGPWSCYLGAPTPSLLHPALRLSSICWLGASTVFIMLARSPRGVCHTVPISTPGGSLPENSHFCCLLSCSLALLCAGGAPAGALFSGDAGCARGCGNNTLERPIVTRAAASLEFVPWWSTWKGLPHEGFVSKCCRMFPQ